MPNNANIDERVVEMRIDNRQFVDGAEKTIGVLDKLKSALSFKGADKSISDVQDSFDKLDLTGIAADVEAISSRFSTLGVIGTQALKNITDKAVNFVESTVKSLAIDPVTLGFSKYEDVLRSTYTILAATKEETPDPERYGSQLEYVNDQLAALNWYTDETSWNLQDMVNNVGKFTNAGVKLEDAVVAMQGIGNWASQAGATTQEASRAMYNLSQAMAVGTVKLMDWRSIENANMATREFKQQVLDTAVDLETLKKGADGVYRTMKGTVVSAENFNEALSEGWFSSDVLKQTLWDYGEFSRRMQATLHDTGMEKYGIVSTDVLEWVDAIVDGTETLESWQDALRASVDKGGYGMGDAVPKLEQLQYAFELLSDAEIENSRNAFLMGQEYHTFQDVLDATKDAVSTGWMKTFQTIIGDADEAKKVWKAVGDEFYDIFAAGGATRNAILGFWADPSTFDNEAYQNLVSGRESLLNAIRNLYEGIRTYIDPVVKAFKSVFSLGDGAEGSARKLLDITYAFESFTERIALSDEAVEGMKNFFTTVFSGVKRSLAIFKPFLKALGTGIGYVKDFVEVFFESFSGDGFDVNYFLESTGILFEDISKNIGNAWRSAVDFFDSFSKSGPVVSVVSFIRSSFEYLLSIFGESKDTVEDIESGTSKLESPLSKVSELWSNIKSFIGEIEIDTSKLRESFGRLGEIISTVYEGVVGDPTEFKNRIKAIAEKAIEGIKEALKEIKLGDVLEGARIGSLIYVGLEFAKFVSSFTAAAKKFESIPESISGVFNSLSTTIESYGKAKAADTMIKIAAAILILTVAMVGLSFVPTEKLVEVATVLGVLMAIIMKISKNLGETGKMSRNKTTITLIPKLAASIIAIAVFIAAAAGAIVSIGKLSWAEIQKGLTVVGLLLLGMVVSAALLEKLSGEESKLKVGVLAKIIIFAATINAAAKALSTLKDLDKDQLMYAAGAIAIIMLMMAMMIAVSSTASVGGGVGSFLVMLGMVGVMYAMAPLLTGIVAILGGTDGAKKLWTAIGMLAAVAAVAVGFAVLMALIGNMKGAKKGAVLIGVIAAALLAASVALLISVPSILALGAGLVAIVKSLNDSIKDVSEWGPALAILLGLGFALTLIGLGGAALGAGLLMAGVGFLAFSAGLLLSSVAAAALTVVLVPLANAVSEFCTVLASNAVAIIEVVGVMIVMAIVVALLSKKLDIINKFLEICGKLFKAFVDNGPQLLGMLAIIASGVLNFVIQMIPMVIDFLVRAIVTVINGVADSIRTNSNDIVAAIENLISAILGLVIKVFFSLIGDVFGFLTGGLAALLGEDVDAAIIATKNQIASGGNAIAGAVDTAFVGNRESSKTAGADTMVAFAEGVTENTPAATDAAKAAIESIPSSVEPTAKESGQSIVTAFGDAIPLQLSSITPNITKSVDGFTGLFDQSETAGVYGGNFAIGDANGLLEQSGLLNEVYARVGRDAAQSFADAQGIQSPSKVAFGFGGYFIQGLVNGVLANESSATSAYATLGERLNDAVQSAMASIYTLADEDFSITPTITPVVDMTDVTNSAGAISSMFSGNMVSNASRIGRSMSDLEDLASNMQTISESKANMSQDSYVINIYPSEGMDEEAIADTVLYRLSNNITRKGVALG